MTEQPITTAPKDRRILAWGRLYYRDNSDWHIVHWDGRCFRTDDDDWVEARSWLPLPPALDDLP